MQIWESTAWFDEAQSWILAVMKGEDISVNGKLEIIHSRPWSCIIRIPSQPKPFYFKATDGLSAHEIKLEAYLSKLKPKHSPKIIALHPENTWMIMEDAGQRLRESLIAKPDWKHWETALPQYAKIQQKAAHKPELLLGFGLPNRSLAELPRLFDSLLGTELYRIDMEGGLSSREFEAFAGLKEVIRQKADALAAYPVPESVHHGDLHDGNIFHDEDNYSFYDWGDACFAHPFVSLRTAYVSAEIRFGLDEGSPELQRLRNAYLAAWRDYAAEDDLLAAFALAEELWAIPTALNWQAQILAVDERDEFAHIMPSLAQEILGAVKL
jgi:hypothetical protein